MQIIDKWNEMPDLMEESELEDVFGWVQVDRAPDDVLKKSNIHLKKLN